MASVASLIRNINLYIDGISYAGKIASFQPPDLNIAVNEYRAGGMDAPVALDKGMEAVRATFVMRAYDSDFLQSWGVAGGDLTEFVAKAALESYDGEVQPVTITMRGRVVSLRRNAWEGQGETPEVTIELVCSYYKEEVDGDLAIEIDIFNFVRFVNGVDRLQAAREAMGLGNVASITGTVNRIRRTISTVQSLIP